MADSFWQLEFQKNQSNKITWSAAVTHNCRRIRECVRYRDNGMKRWSFSFFFFFRPNVNCWRYIEDWSFGQGKNEGYEFHAGCIIWAGRVKSGWLRPALTNKAWWNNLCWPASFKSHCSIPHVTWSNRGGAMIDAGQKGDWVNDQPLEVCSCCLMHWFLHVPQGDRDTAPALYYSRNQIRMNEWLEVIFTHHIISLLPRPPFGSQLSHIAPFCHRVGPILSLAFAERLR